VSARATASKARVTLDVLGHGYGGEGYARLAEGFVSLPRALPGERVEAEVGEFVRGRAWGRVTRWLSTAAERVAPDCPHYDRCSGCALRHLSRADERAFKLARAREILRRYGPPGVPGELEWVGGAERLGHRARGTFGVSVGDGAPGGPVRVGLRGLGLDGGRVDVRDCPAQTAGFRAVMVAVGQVLDGHPEGASRLRAVTVETAAGGSARLELEGSEELDETLRDELFSLAPAAPLVVELPLRRGPETLRVAVPRGVWHHAAPGLGARLADWVAARVSESGATRLLDLCCGIGTLTARLAPGAQWVLACDENLAAVTALAEALARAGIGQVEVRAGRIGAVLRKLRRDPGARAELAVVNPMRRPLGKKQLRDLPALGVRDVVYCGPAPVSAARDASVLSALGYEMTRAAVVDLHPGTAQLMLAFVCSAAR
jgi:23S rRNA (uracil1939-C5)-methyltransferase